MALIACAVCVAGCFTGSDGREPPSDQLYYPTGLLVSPGGTTLYVANSDFDLQYSAGTVQALDLPAMRAATSVIAEQVAGGATASQACAAANRGANSNAWLMPTPCSPFGLARFVKSHALIGAFASGLLLTHNPLDAGARLFVPVRGDPSITWFEVDDDRNGNAGGFRLDCGQDSAGACNADSRLGQDPDRTLRGVQLPADPVGIAATADGRHIVSAHQTQAAASLVINDWDSTPELAFFTGSLALGPTEVAAIPEPAFVTLAEETDDAFTYRRGFAITFRGAAELDLVRVNPDAGAAPPRPFITRSTVVPVTTSASNFDSRGIGIIDRARRQCESTCGATSDELGCLVACAEQVPLRVFMANRAPASLLIGEMRTLVSRATVNGQETLTSATEELFFYDSVPLNFGPSRVEIGNIIDSDGNPSERVFAVAFDSRTVFMFNPFEHRMEAVIRSGRGPHDVAFDTGVDANGEAFSYLYVGHFTDSWLGIVDLDSRRPFTYSQMFAAVGALTVPVESN
jgi:DNA-binding beta-propeller fold protein YncE